MEEKEKKVRLGMRMMGLRTGAYWTVWVARVVVSFVDPDPRVAGGGIRTLRGAGIAVACGCEEETSRRINAPFLTRIAAERAAADAAAATAPR